MNASLRGVDLSQITSFLLLVGQLGLLLLVADVFLIEQTYGFSELIPVIFFGFAVHSWLPREWRAAFFLLLFPVSAFTLLGAVGGAALIGLGIVLFLLCHLPVPIMARTAILIAVGAALAVVRADVIDLPLPRLTVYIKTQTLPILSAMFMFRAIVYLYDLRHEKGPVSLWQRLGYFFLFPNVCFPLFPVVDYQTYKRTYFNRASHEIYQQGMDWILRGITHLLLYRVVYHYFVPDPDSVDSLAEVGQYALSSFLLYLRVSGLFHLIIGVLCLFGYNLPETHHRYYLSESFTDFWRRINIYWKDFMMKLFYYPIYLRLRGWGTTRAMIAATLITFVITWALHSYQWFWLRGSISLLPQDMLFWAILAVLVTGNSLYEERYGRRRKSLTKKVEVSPRDATTRSLKVLVVFLSICLLWSFWTSSSIEQWLSVMSVALNGSVLEWLSFFTLCAFGVGIGILVQLFGDRFRRSSTGRPFSVARRAAWVGTAAILLLAIANPGLSNRLDSRAGNLIATITGDQLNTRDQRQLVKGYYEDLLGAESVGSMVWNVRLKTPDDWDWNGAPLSEHAITTGDIRRTAYLPSMTVRHKGRDFTTNSWGLHGPEIELSKPAATYRIAVLGSSYTEGAGMQVEQIFPFLLQEQLNDSNTGAGLQNFEVLNISYGGDSILRRLARLQKNGIPFDIDLVLDVPTTVETDTAVRDLRDAVADSTPDLDPFLLEVAARAGATAEMSREEIERLLMPYGEELCRWGYEQLARIAERYDFPVIVFVLPLTGDTDPRYWNQWDIVSNLSSDAGLTVVDLHDVYGPLSERHNLRLAPWDWHPNMRGHELIAARIYRELMELDIIPVASTRYGGKTTEGADDQPTHRNYQ